MRSVNSQRVARGEISCGSADICSDLPNQEADGRTDRRHRQRVGVTCNDCLHYPICFERRGPCREFKTLEMIKNDIKMLNANYTKTSAGSGADQGSEESEDES